MSPACLHAVPTGEAKGFSLCQGLDKAKGQLQTYQALCVYARLRALCVLYQETDGLPADCDFKRGHAKDDNPRPGR